MSSMVHQARTKDHWSLRLHIKRPGTASRMALLALGVIQALLLTLTASGMATGGGLYGCSSACGTRAEPTVPALAVLLGIVMLLLPLVMGALSFTWQMAVAAAALPWIPAIIIGANALLAPAASVVPAPAATPAAHGHAAAQPALVSHFGPPFWLDSSHLTVMLFSLVFFVLLGWIGWVVGQAVRNA